MSVLRIANLVAITGLCAAAFLPAQETGPGVAPGKQTLVFPVSLASSGAQPTPSPECVVTFGPPVPISALAFSPDGKLLAVGGYREVLLWDLTAANPLRRIGTKRLSGRVDALVFLKEGSQLAVGDGVPGKSGRVRLFNVKSGRSTGTLDGPSDSVHCLAVSPDGELLAAGGAYKEVHVWSTKSKKLVQTIEGHTGWVTGVCFSPDGHVLGTAGADQTLRVWRVDTWERTLRAGYSEAAHGLAFSPDSRNVAVAVGGPGERAIRVGSKDRARGARAVAVGEGMPLDVQWAPRTNQLYVACSDETIRVCPARGGRLTTLRGHTDWVYAVALSPDGTRLASGSGDGTVKLWNTADGKLMATFVQLSPRADDWLIMTAQGYLATSSPDAISWRTNGVSTPAAELTTLFHKVESVRDALAGNKLTPPALKQN